MDHKFPQEENKIFLDSDMKTITITKEFSEEMRIQALEHHTINCYFSHSFLLQCHIMPSKWFHECCQISPYKKY